MSANGYESCWMKEVKVGFRLLIVLVKCGLVQFRRGHLFHVLIDYDIARLSLVEW